MRTNLAVLTVQGVLGLAAGLWFGAPMVVRALMMLMVIDVLTGIFAAAIQKRLSSRESYKGLGRKGLVLCLIAAASVIQGHLQEGGNLPLAQIVAGFYVANEAISILENVSAAGVPVPGVLKNILERLQEKTKALP